jgi:SAM-dependent methyltransferase
MPDATHEDVVRESFRAQVAAFSGPDSVYARRSGPLSWIEPLDASMIALDIACGAAHAAESVAPHVRQVVGVDLTAELLALGANRLRQAGIGNVLLQEGNAEALPFADASFDLAFCRSSLHHFAAPRRAIEEMWRVTNSDGRIVLLDLVAPPGPVRGRFDALHRLLDPSHVETFTADELIDHVTREGVLTYCDTLDLRLPIDVAIAENSDRDGAMAALKAELEGGPATGFEPEQDADSVTVKFVNLIIHATRTP